MTVLTSLGIFILAGLCEIGGGYLMWQWLKVGKQWWIGLLGAVILVGYGIVATLQPANFGRVYAAYGGIFIAIALLWGWKVDGITPHRFDIIGAVLAIVGMFIILFAPRP